MSSSQPSPAAVTRFLAEFAALGQGALTQFELLPVRLMRALTQTAPVDGAGLSLLSGPLRIPLGASNDAAGAAERLQTTLGEGPCLGAYEHNRTVVANEVDLPVRWPMFWRELREQTPFRAVASVPIYRGSTARMGAIDLYWSTPQVPNAFSADDLAATLQIIMPRLLLSAPDRTDPDAQEPVKAWLLAEPVRRRLTVWSAIGLLNVENRLGNEDALAVLRAAAYARGTTIDELAEQLINRQTSIDVDEEGTS